MLTLAQEPNATEDVRIGAWDLPGVLGAIHNPEGIVVFFQGSGDRLNSPRNRFVLRYCTLTGWRHCCWIYSPCKKPKTRKMFLTFPCSATA